MNGAQRYSRPAIWLHWIVAALIIVIGGVVEQARLWQALEIAEQQRDQANQARQETATC